MVSASTNRSRNECDTLRRAHRSRAKGYRLQGTDEVRSVAQAQKLDQLSRAEEALTDDLFSSEARCLTLPMADADVVYVPSIPLPRSSDVLAQSLIETTPWLSEEVFVWGKRHPQPRLVAWYGDPNRPYSYSGITLEPLPWTELLIDLKIRVEQVAHNQFNSVLLNYYRDQQDSMGMHSDDEPELGARPIIASLSLGQERTLIFKHRTSSSVKPVRLPLASGSVLVMKGDTQANWRHGINKEEKPCGPRVNLTFRRIRSPTMKPSRKPS